MKKIKQIRSMPLEEVEVLEDSLLIDKKMLVISDLHIGYEGGQGLNPFSDIPIENIKEKLDRIFRELKRKHVKLEEIIICGDLKHEFGKILDTEWRGILSILDFIKKKCKKIIIVEGNHDKTLEPVIKKGGVDLVDSYLKGRFCFLHGDKLLKASEKANIIIFGHLHPAITLTDKYKSEKFKCFLRGGVGL